MMPGIGRFAARDTHWHPENMIYGILGLASEILVRFLFWMVLRKVKTCMPMLFAIR